MIILLYNRYDELKLLIIPAFYQPSTKQLIIASHTKQLGWRKLSDIWINRVALGWISAISLKTFQFFNGYFLRVNPQVKQFSPNSYSVWWALQYDIWNDGLPGYNVHVSDYQQHMIYEMMAFLVTIYISVIINHKNSEVLCEFYIIIFLK